MNKTLDNVLKELFADLTENGNYIDSRCGGCYEIENYQFSIDPVHAISSLAAKRYMLGEMAWYASGRNDLEYIQRYSTFWEKLAVDGKLNSAYGVYINRQLMFCVQELRNNPQSRRAVINISGEDEDKNGLDVRCTIALQFLIRNNKLHLTGMMRSNDMRRGTPYDVPAFCMYGFIVANMLGIEFTKYTHFATSMHIYEYDIDDTYNRLYRDAPQCEFIPRGITMGAMLYLATSQPANIVETARDYIFKEVQ